MAYQTDSDGNFFVCNSLDTSGYTFATDLPDCLTAAFGAGNYAVSLPNPASITGIASIYNTRLEWRPQGVGETLTGAITLNTSSNQLYNETNTGTNIGILNANARFGIRPFDNNSSYATQTPMRNIAGQYINIYPTNVSASVQSMSDSAVIYATITQQEVIFFATNPGYTQFILSYQGVLQNIPSPFSGNYPKGSVGVCFANAFSSLQVGGISIWTDNTVRRLIFYNHALACTSASGQTFGSNFWMTDFPFMFNSPANNYPAIGTAKNLKLGVGAGLVPGNIYQPGTPVDGGSNLWLCAANYTPITNGKLMIRVKT